MARVHGLVHDFAAGCQARGGCLLKMYLFRLCRSEGRATYLWANLGLSSFSRTVLHVLTYGDFNSGWTYISSDEGRVAAG